MRTLRRILLLTLWLLIVVMSHYEVTAKTPGWVGKNMPGRLRALQADKRATFHHHTGIMLVDRLLHEGDHEGTKLRPPATQLKELVHEPAKG